MCGRSVLRTARAATSDASRVSFLLEICNPTHEKVIEVRTQSDPWINKPKPDPCPPLLRRATRSTDNFQDVVFFFAFSRDPAVQYGSL